MNVHEHGLGRPSKSRWEDLINQYHHCTRAYEAVRPYINLDRMLSGQLAPEAQANLTRVLSALNRDLVQMDLELIEIKKLHTNRLGEPYTGEVTTFNADGLYLQVSTEYISWHEKLSSIVTQPIADIEALTNGAH